MFKVGDVVTFIKGSAKFHEDYWSIRDIPELHIIEEGPSFYGQEKRWYRFRESSYAWTDVNQHFRKVSAWLDLREGVIDV